MTFADLLEQSWKQSNSSVCVGLDPEKVPAQFASSRQPLFELNKAIIDATQDLACAFKPQIAYYAAAGAEDQLARTIEYIKTNYPRLVVILDAKRGDIGSTARMYAREAFERYGADAVTVNPYMGGDTLKPFLDYADKGVVVLCRTSNPGASQFQGLLVEGTPLYLHVAARASAEWNAHRNLMLVVGATAPEELSKVRAACPTIPLLVPGVGAQGGDVEQVVKRGVRGDGLGLVINSSRGIMYAGDGPEFAQAARNAAQTLRDQINAARA